MSNLGWREYFREIREIREIREVRDFLNSLNSLHLSFAASVGKGRLSRKVPLLRGASKYGCARLTHHNRSGVWLTPMSDLGCREYFREIREIREVRDFLNSLNSLNSLNTICCQKCVVTRLGYKNSEG